eukprot:438851-Heterocapsa_arctica.AAC.1
MSVSVFTKNCSYCERLHEELLVLPVSVLTRLPASVFTKSCWPCTRVLHEELLVQPVSVLRRAAGLARERLTDELLALPASVLTKSRRPCP